MSKITDHHNKYSNNKEVWDIMKISKMWPTQSKQVLLQKWYWSVQGCNEPSICKETKTKKPTASGKHKRKNEVCL